MSVHQGSHYRVELWEVAVIGLTMKRKKAGWEFTKCTVFISYTSQSKLPQTWWLKATKPSVSQFWRSEVRNQDVGRASIPPKDLGENFPYLVQYLTATGISRLVTPSPQPLPSSSRGFSSSLCVSLPFVSLLTLVGFKSHRDNTRAAHLEILNYICKDLFPNNVKSTNRCLDLDIYSGALLLPLLPASFNARHLKKFRNNTEALCMCYSWSLSESQAAVNLKTLRPCTPTKVSGLQLGCIPKECLKSKHSKAKGSNVVDFHGCEFQSHTEYHRNSNN